jgi:hypothetical protein
MQTSAQGIKTEVVAAHLDIGSAITPRADSHRLWTYLSAMENMLSRACPEQQSCEAGSLQHHGK